MQTVNLVIGANGGIGRILVKILAEQEHGTPLIAVSRAFDANIVWPENVIKKELDTADEIAIAQLISAMKKRGMRAKRVFCTVGLLHNDKVAPEKKLEEIHVEQLANYFAVNAILPALWLKHLIEIVISERPIITCVSARVGSIADNQLGGWYGYRASKAALNQLVKTASIEYARRLKDPVLVCYQPGTVDTGLSKPFQTNVKAENLFDPAFAVRQLLSITSNLHAPPHCRFVDWQGETINW
ncbi:SDR family NAD(P)-dependent oxidoreductase [Alteromonas ponticola]|uniref:SDR family NAD(P)-dependent oxidoreductase n=1 Tax=Alteromonas aquimaris TaxID=2998417 RepID=A0ABT3PA35_9ALTE|nr:SDR family NAD(P)-dependent oxidoreductase [Alteromonas aquimaris]MCW8109643.1 SDR family NAD(P)-dependent oxidoreductase [Alteromonas aquimaris]